MAVGAQRGRTRGEERRRGTERKKAAELIRRLPGYDHTKARNSACNTRVGTGHHSYPAPLMSSSRWRISIIAPTPCACALLPAPAQAPKPQAPNPSSLSHTHSLVNRSLVHHGQVLARY